MEKNPGNKKFILLILISIFGLTALFPFQYFIEKKLIELEKRAVGSFENALGCKISYGSISPSLLRFLEVRELYFHDESQPNEPVLYLERVRIFYDLPGLFSEDPIGAITRVSIEDSRVEIDAQRDEKVIDFIKRFLASSSSGLNFPVSGRNLAMKFRNENTEFSLSTVFFTLTPTTGDKVAVDFSANQNLNIWEHNRTLFNFFSGLRIQGSIDPEFEWAELRVSLNSPESTYFSLEDLVVQVNYRNDLLTVYKSADTMPLDIFTSYDLNANIISFKVICEDFRFTDLVSLKGFTGYEQTLLQTVLVGSFEGSISPENQTAAYSGDLSVAFEHPFIAGVPVTGRFIFNGDEQEARFSTSYLNSSVGSLDYQGSLFLQRPLLQPRGALSVRQVLVGNFPLSSDIVFSQGAYPDQTRINVDAFNLGVLRLDKITADVFSRSGRNHIVELSVFMNQEISNSIEAEQVRIVQLNAGFRIGADPSVSGSLETFDLSCFQVASLFIDNTLITSGLADFRITSSWNFNISRYNFGFTSDQLMIHDDSQDVPILSFAVTGNNEAILFESLNFNKGNFLLTGSIEFVIGSAERIAIRAQWSTSGVDYALTGMFNPGRSLYLYGSNGFQLNLDTGNDQVQLNVKARDFPVPLGGYSAVLNVQCRGVYINNQEWMLTIPVLSVRDFLPDETKDAQGAGFLELSAVFTPDNSRIYQLRFQNTDTNLVGQGEFDISRLFSDFRSYGWVVISDPDKEEEYRLVGSLDKEAVDGYISFSGVPPSRVGLSRELQGTFEGRAEVTGTTGSPNVNLSAALNHGSLNNQPVHFTLEAGYSDRNIRLKQLYAQFLSQSITLTNGNYDLDLGDANIMGRFSVGFSQGLFDAEIGTTVKLPPVRPDQGFFPNFAQGNVSGIINIKQTNTPQDSEPIHWKVNFIKDSQGLSVTGLDDALIFNSTDSGDFTIRLTDSLPVSFSAAGRFFENTVEADINRIRIDIDAVSPFLLFNFEEIQLSFSDGLLIGELSVSGQVSDPAFNGYLNSIGSIGSVSVVPGNVAISEIAAPLFVMKDRVIQLSQTYLITENGDAIISGQFVLDHLRLVRTEIHIESVEKRDIYTELALKEIQAKGFVSGYLDIIAMPLLTTLTGNFVVSSGIVTTHGEYTELVDKTKSPGTIGIDLTITTGEDNRLILPNERNPLLTALLISGNEIKIQGDSGSYFSVTGEARVNGGIISYLNQDFFINTGSISFNETQGIFDPRITARAETLLLGAEGERIRIYLVAENTSINNFQPYFESQPFFTDTEIMAMLSGLIPNSQQDNISTTVIPPDIFVQMLLNQIDVVRDFNSTIRDFFGFDQFAFRTPVITNFLFDQVLYGGDTQSDQLSLSLARLFDRTSIFFGWNFASILYLQGQIQFAYQPGNTMYQDVLTSTQGSMSLLAELRIEFHTPITLLELSIIPDFFDKDSPVSANLGLSWYLNF